MSKTSSSNPKKTKPVIKETPLVKQYNSIKVNHPNRLLLFRMGDFFELFGLDAETAAPVLDIALTKRNKKDENSDFMCGFPHHAMEAHVNKLLKSGYSVAICDQVEDPKEAKGLVKREVVMMLSPGVVFNPDSLDAESSHYLFAFDDKTACWFEPSTGKAFYKNYSGLENLDFIIKQIKPAEVLYKTKEEKEGLFYFENRFSEYEGEETDPKLRLLDYVKTMQGSESLFSFLGWVEFSDKEKVKLSKNFFNHLEVFESNERESSAKCLIDSIKRTKTPGGTRLLKEWLLAPTRNLQVLDERLNRIDNWSKDYEYLKFFREGLAHVGDLDRRIVRAGHSLGNPTDFLRLKRSLSSVLYSYSREKNVIWKNTATKVVNLIESSIEEEHHAQWSSKGGYIKKGFHKEMDELIGAAAGSQAEVTALEERERLLTKIPSLKIRYNNVFGFYIEVTKVHALKVPDHYMRKQTLTNAERYTTEELAKIEEKVLSAQTKKLALEKELFIEIKDKVRSLVKDLKEISAKVSADDVYSSWAFLSLEKGYSKPEFDKDMNLKLLRSFHPVVSDDLKTFVTNDLLLSEADCLLITGPNMAGKSTVMRQVVISSYLALCGFYVPAETARIPLYDGLYTRIGASDLLSRGLSTFMVEMKETAEILEESSKESLLILDEIGRGTSSSDGMALARSILEYIVNKKRSHTFFATHYHELKDLEHLGIKNVHMAYSNEGQEIKFLYKLLKGASEKSYGIEVAKLAGLPSLVTDLAFKMSNLSLDAKKDLASDLNTQFKEVKKKDHEQMDFLSMINKDTGISISEEEGKLLEEIKTLKTNQMTPLEALNTISKWQDNYL